MKEYENGCSIELSQNGDLTIIFGDKSFQFNESGKPTFDNGLGETVIEYTGLSADNTEAQSLAKANYKPEAYSELHYHQKLTEDYYIISGHAKVILDDKEYHLSPGDHIRIPSGQRHQVFNESAEKELNLIVQCVPAWIKEDFHLVNTQTLGRIF